MEHLTAPPAGGVPNLQALLPPAPLPTPTLSSLRRCHPAAVVPVPATRVGSKHNGCTVPRRPAALFCPELEANKEALIHTELSGAPGAGITGGGQERGDPF